MPGKDIYADLEKIEARGKRKKEKRKGLFSSFNKAGEEEDSEHEISEPESEIVEMELESPPEPPKPSQDKPDFCYPHGREMHKPTEPKPDPVPEPVKAPEPKPLPAPVANEASLQRWTPLSGGALRRAETELYEYKKWLNKGFKAGKLTKEQCLARVVTKEIELGLRPPE